MDRRLTKYLFIAFGLVALIACLALASQNASAIDAHLDYDGWEWHYDTAVPATLTRVVQTGATTEITIPASLDGSTPLTTIAAQCFNDNEGHKITKILSMPATVTSMGQEAIANCNLLTDVNLGTSGLVSIGYYGVSQSNQIASIILPSTLTTISSMAFSYDVSLTSITFLGLVAPTNVVSNWIHSSPAGIRGHAYAPSTFPAPGAAFNGLTMGTLISTNASATTLVIPAGQTMASSVAGSTLTITGAITISAGGQLDATNIAWINCGGNFNPSAGTWISDDGQVNITSSYKTVKLTADQTFYDLQLVNNTNVTGQASVTHLIKYSGMGTNNYYHWKNASVIGDYQANSSGLIDIAGRILYIANLYRMEFYSLPTWAPTFTSSPSTSITINHAYSYTPTCNESVTFTVDTKPAWATWVSPSYSGSPNSAGVYAFHIQATSTGGTLIANQYWNVTVSGAWAPTFTNSPATTGTKNIAYSYTATINETGTFASVTKPAWASWSSPTYSGTPTSPGVYAFHLQATSTAGTLTANKYWNVTVFDTWAPSFTSSPILSVYNGSDYNYTVTLNESVILNLSTVAGWLTLTHEGTNITPYELHGVGTPIGNYTMNLSAYSELGTLTAWQNFSIEVFPAIPPPPPVLYPPIITTLPTLSVNIGYSYTYSALANQSVVWVITSNASWASISNNSISGIVNILDVGEYYVHIVGSNANGTVYQNYTVTIMAPITTLSDTSIIWLVLLLTFTAIGIIRVRLFGIFTGIIWIVAALIFFYPSYGYILMLFPLGFGMLWMVISLNELMSTEVKA